MPLTHCTGLEIITCSDKFSHVIYSTLMHLSLSTLQFMHMILTLCSGSLRAVPWLINLYIFLGTYHSLACSRNLINVYCVNEFKKRLSILFYSVGRQDEIRSKMWKHSGKVKVLLKWKDWRLEYYTSTFDEGVKILRVIYNWQNSEVWLGY